MGVSSILPLAEKGEIRWEESGNVSREPWVFSEYHLVSLIPSDTFPLKHLRETPFPAMPVVHKRTHNKSGVCVCVLCQLRRQETNRLD